MKRLMGLDVGSRRIGIALSDALGVIAQAYEVRPVEGTEEDARYIQGVCERERVGDIVIGYPLRTDGSAGPEALYVRRFRDVLRDYVPTIPIHLWDERFSTREAERLLIEQKVRRRRRRNVVDMAAAAIILQAFMDRRANE